MVTPTDEYKIIRFPSSLQALNLGTVFYPEALT